MLFKLRMNLLKPFRRHLLTQELFAALVPNPVKNAASQRRSHRPHNRIEQKGRRLLVHVPGDHQIHGKAEGGSVHGGDKQYPPRTHGSQNFPKEGGVLGEDGLYRFQKKILTNSFDPEATIRFHHRLEAHQAGTIMHLLMSLPPCTQLGPYEIAAPRGAGGMGEVYRARDTRLDRTVAIKILSKEESIESADHKRFQREAKILSQLKHPHICVLHDVGSLGSVEYLVMECVDGETLAKRLVKGPLLLEQALKYGSQIADALDAAHRSGVVHRDLKPGNVMLTPDGAKLLDFGLAKPVIAPAAATTRTHETRNSPVTEEGSIVGTFQYMSPEQIEGKQIDGRSDIFSFGAVLYEMVTGKRAFEGASRLSVASAILEKEPTPIGVLKPLSPPALDHTIRRCLMKQAEERWQTARDLASELRWIGEASSQTSPRPSNERKRPQWLFWSLATVATAFLLWVVIAFLRVPSSNSSVIVAEVTPPKGTQFNSPTLSPDGRTLAFTARDSGGKSSLWIRRLDSLAAQHVAGTEDADSPFWSPDSRRIGFSSSRGLMTVDAAGSTAMVVTDRQGFSSGSWSRNGQIAFVGERGIYDVPATGGVPAIVLPRDTSKYAFFADLSFLPDGKHFLYSAGNISSPGDVYFASISGKENRMILEHAGNALYASGFLLYPRGTALMAQPFDSEKGKFTAAAVPVIDQIQRGEFDTFFDASQNGVLIYEPGDRAPRITQLAWFD